MKIKFRMYGVLALAGVMALSGCSSGKTGGNDNSASPSSTAVTNKDTGSTAPVKVIWFADASFWNPPQPWNTDPNTVEGTITKKTGLTFDFNIPPQDAVTKLSLMLATSDKLPDVITVSDNILIKKLIQADKVWKLDDFLKKYDPSSPLLTKFPNDLKKALVERDGDWYSYPSHMYTPDATKLYPPSSDYYADSAKYTGGHGGLMFNEQIMQQAGISPDDLKTEDGVLAAFKKVKGMTFNGSPVIPLQIDGKTYSGISVDPVGFPNGQVNTLGTLENMFGAMPVDKNGVYRDTILAPETKHALDFLFQAAQGGYFDPSQMTLDTTATKAAVVSGRVFCFMGNTANTGFTDENAASTWITPGPIQSNQNTKPVMGKHLQAGVGWMQTFISKTAPEPERIAKWLDFMTSNEGLLLNYYGFEGTDYNLNKNGVVVQTEQGRKDAADYSKTGVFAFWPFHNAAWHDHATEAPSNKKGNDGIMAFQVGTALGRASHIFDSSVFEMPSDFIPTGSKMANDRLQINTYLEAQVSKIILAKDAATMNQYYNEMIAKLKQMGLDDIDAKVNEQFHKQEKTFGVTIKGINS
jgi:putative aldouronate transport system substrate-binding protein